ncbi:hypothetical protein BO78DRAFT_404402 [Aspergillus sclerotiicarbonarius CBS 121057]|uniref:Uncharacterized protein n=1 Tax=Aspergillus sclerotiicarbonarius (strain CBS 121057 / IBT 28362) TaxID=1448318 RepID=A0A319FM54_ASPSB|nr:hypothetical protein BO78DRAFT_404402 [Aspergillus sclerotiicarbonarius CBS 121057]
MAEPLPVILCGKTEKIGETVIATLKPEFEVIHFVMTPESGAVQIPALLRGETDVPFDSELGSKDYSRGIAAIILGGGYEDAGIYLMREAAKGIKSVPWLRPDLSKPAPPLGPEYGKAMVERIKVTVKELQDKGTMSEDAMVYY